MRRLMAMGLVLLLVWMAFLPVQAQTAPTLSVSPTSGSGGTTITYHGTGYTPGGDVSVLFTGDGLPVSYTHLTLPVSWARRCV